MKRIEIALKDGLFDAQGQIDAQTISDSLGLEVEVEYRKVFTEDLGISDEEAEKFGKALCHPVTHTAEINAVHENDFDHIIEVGYKPGVMDPEGRSAKDLAQTVLGKEFPFERKIAVQHQRRIKGSLTDIQLKKIAGLFSNDTVQNFRVWKKEELAEGIAPYVPTVKVPPPEPVRHYDMNQNFDAEKYVNEAVARAKPEDKEKAAAEARKKAESWVNTVKQYYKRELSEEELLTAAEWLHVSEDRTLALDVAEMEAIWKHHSRPDIIEARKKVGLSEKPTDVELEHKAQAWSEHCGHKMFNAAVTYREGDNVMLIEEGIFKHHIRSATLAIQRQRPDFIKSVLWDNSGVIDLDPNSRFYFCFKCETHNSPSFMEPYGGAITGIVGVYRDPMGTGRGSQLTFGVWGYCTGSPFYDGDLLPPLHPDMLITGIHRGVRDGGNKHGVPTAIGGTFFDDGYLGKCLVYVGAAGRMPKTVDGIPGYDKWIDVGDRVIVVGGRVGKDGIHGATASSKEYSEEGTPAGHVQIGDPYTQKNVQEFMLEALEAGCINFAQDSGAGGIGSAAGEMAGMVKSKEEIAEMRRAALETLVKEGKASQSQLQDYAKAAAKNSEPAKCKGGAVVNLDKDLFKYEGMAPWEILESESQERMFLAVNPDKVEKLSEIAKKWNVEWRDIGEFTDTGYFHVQHKGETVAYEEMEFHEHGLPQKRLDAVWKTPEERGLAEPAPEKVYHEDQTEVLHNILKRENVASKEFLQREYDTRVQGRTVIPAFIGKSSDVPSDAFVQKMDFELESGVACGIGLNPSYSDIDTYHMTMMAANEGLMRVVAVGADPDRAANNGNYCWPGVLPEEAASTEDAEYKMAQLVRASTAQHDFMLATGVATISGKDSMKIQGKIRKKDGTKETVYGKPTIQFATVANVPDVGKCVTADFKKSGDLIYVVGSRTKDELGGSEFYAMHGETGRNVPEVDPYESMEACRRLHEAVGDEKAESIKVCSKGGFAVALTQAAFAGGYGARVDLGAVPVESEGARKIDYREKNADAKVLYSESASRFIVTVAPGNCGAFEDIMGPYAAHIGQVSDKYVEVTGTQGATIIKESTTKLKESWKSTFKHKSYHQKAEAPA